MTLLAQKSATQYGDGEGSLAFWKNSISDYHDDKKVIIILVAKNDVYFVIPLFIAQV